MTAPDARTIHATRVRAQSGAGASRAQRQSPRAAARGASEGRNIVHVSTADLAGGAARAAYRLHRALCSAGESSKLFVGNKESADDDVIAFQPQPRLDRRLNRLARKEWLKRQQTRALAGRPAHFEHFRDDRTELGSELLQQLPSADILNLHWIAEFVDYRHFLPEAARRVPIVWTLHDMNPFTGGCHYDLGCGRYVRDCGACPQLASMDENDFSRQIHRRKAAVFGQLPPERVRVVAGSRWMADAAGRSSLFSRFPIDTIHCGVDTSVFRPRDGKAFRRALDIPENAFVVLFAADQVENHRKGLPLLIEALQGLRELHRDLRLVTVGAGCPRFEIDLPHLHLGRFGSDDMLAIYYSCGDCFVIPSRQEAFGLTALEAMACGTPAIGFNAGGIPDMITPGKTGLLARAEDPSDLARQIHWMLEHGPEREQMAREARRQVEATFTIERQARRYQELYDETFAAAATSAA